MQDDFVCGSDYENCLDPTGKWIVNGEVVVGSQPDKNTPVDADIATMLRNKIGVINGRGRPSGMCAAVMQKCQNYTMQDGKYNADNALIAEYVSQTIIKIKARRAALLDEYAQGCIADVISCLGRNNRGASMNSDSAINSCMPVIKTCKSLTTGNAGDLDEIRKWLANVIGTEQNTGDDTTQPDNPYVPPTPNPGINDEGEYTDAELVVMQQQDIDACLKLGNTKISVSGAMCILYGVDASETLDSVTQRAKDAVAAYGGVVTYDIDSAHGNSETFGKFPALNGRMYMMRFAYYRAKQHCQAFGGTLRFKLGGLHEAPSCSFVPVENEAECNAFRPNGARGPFPEELFSIYDADKKTCSFLAQGAWYMGKEIPGTCQSGFVEDVNDPGECVVPN